MQSSHSLLAVLQPRNVFPKELEAILLKCNLQEIYQPDLQSLLEVRSLSLISAFQLVFLVAQTVKNPPVMQETWIQSLGQKQPVEKGKAAHSSILAWRIPWTEEPGSLHSTGHKSQTWLSDQAWAYRITIAPFSFNAPQGFLLAQGCCSVTKPCPTLCYCMDCGMPGSSALPYLLEFA